MKLHVSDEIQKATTHCEKGFSCLAGDRKDICTVETCVVEKIYFIKCLNEGYCSYQHQFGSAYFCDCPTRKDLFNKYKV